MSEELILGFAGNLITLIVASGGCSLALHIQHNNKVIERHNKRLHQINQEVGARIAFEGHVWKEIAERGVNIEGAVHLRLRKALQQKTGMQPKLTRCDAGESFCG